MNHKLKESLVEALNAIVRYGSPDTVLVRASKTLRTEILALELAVRPSGGAWVLTAKGSDFLSRMEIK